MSSAKSNSSEPGAPKAGAGLSPGSIVAVVVALALLAGLVWAIRPRRPDFKPAPLEPQPEGCLILPRAFVPTNLTELPGSSIEALPQAAKYRALLRLNMQPCACGCKLSIAACRISNPKCKVSADLEEKIVKEESAQPPARAKKNSGAARR